MRGASTSLCILIMALVCTAVAAQTNAVDYGPETGIISFGTMPGFISAKSSAVSLSDEHSKLGENSLRWDWRRSGASLTFDVPVDYLPENPDPDDTSVSSFVFWAYAPEALDGRLRFSFLKNGKECCGFDFLLGFTGWRGAWVAFDRDMEGTPEKDMDAVRITYTGKSRHGKLFFDGVIPASFQDVRYHTPDWQLPFVNPDNTNFWLLLNREWQNPLDIALSECVTSRDAEDFSTIEERFKTLVTEGVKIWPVEKIREYYKSWNISFNPDGTIKGKPVWFVRYAETYLHSGVDAAKDFADNGQLLKDLNDAMVSIARSWAESENAAEKKEIGEMYVNLTRLLLDQGFQAGSGLGTVHHLGYSMRNFYNAPVIAKELLRENALLESVQQAMSWFSGLGEVKLEPEHDGMDVDAFNTLLMGRLASVIMMEDSPLKVATMKAFSRWADNGYKYTEGLNPAFKRDGTVVHHRKCYPAYATGGFKGSVNAIWILSGTSFAISRQSHENQKRALMEMRFWCNLRSFPLAMSGRHPDGFGELLAYQYALLADAGSPDGTEGIDRDLAAAYLRLNAGRGGKWEKKFIDRGLVSEESPVGGRFYPYDCSLSYRQDDWLVTLAGHSRYIWAAEHYQGANMYGRYLAHGSMQIIGRDLPAPDSFGSGFSGDGWDWTHIPGTTAAAIPVEEMKADILNVDQYSGFEEMLLSDESFAGGVSYGKDAAVYSFILHEHDKYNPSLRARKSWFAFGNRIVCLGSGIENDRESVHTTLFQNSLRTGIPTVIDGREYGGNPWSATFAGGCSLTDRLGNFYYVPSCNVTVTRSEQHSFHEENCKPTAGSFETAYIDHGEHCRGGSYIYAVIPGPSSSDAKAALPASYEVLRCDNRVHQVRDLESGIVAASVFETSGIDSLVLSATPSVLIYSESGGHLSLSLANPDLALYEGPSDEVFDGRGKRLERSIYGRTWVNNPAGETSVTLVLEGEWRLLSHICGEGLECYERLEPSVELKDGKTVLTVRTKECRQEELKLEMLIK